MDTPRRELVANFAALLRSSRALVQTIAAGNRAPPKLITPQALELDVRVRSLAQVIDQCDAWLRRTAEAENMNFDPAVEIAAFAEVT